LNRRLSRTEFMPFAPVVTERDAAELFGVGAVNAYAARFMTITSDVRPHWRERIAAVVHIDGSARPQIIEREANPLYYDTLAEFSARTAIPALVNTSFNVHEEPIVTGRRNASERWPTAASISSLPTAPSTACCRDAKFSSASLSHTRFRAEAGR